MFDINQYQAPFTECYCGCGGALDSRRFIVQEYDPLRNISNNVPYKEVIKEYMRVVTLGGGVSHNIGKVCECGAESTYGVGCGHSDWCPKHV